MHDLRSKPRSPSELIESLSSAQDGLGKGGRRLANFFIENLGETALLSSSEVARRCGVNASSVVRLAQSLGFTGYRDFQSVLQQHLSASMEEAKQSTSGGISLPEIARPLRLYLLIESGPSFNAAALAAAKNFAASNPSVEIDGESFVSNATEPSEFGRRIREAAKDYDGIILVAREDPAINDAVREATGNGVPVVCLTTDLPLSGRTAYVGSDQYVSGATAAWLCGRMLAKGEAGKVLFVYSVPFRCHQDREQGFRHVLRSEFPSLAIDERVSSNESVEVVYDAVRRYFAKSGAPAAIYNVSGANMGVGEALEAEGVSRSTIFIGHELNANSRSLLERGIMDITIGHDVEREIALSVDCIRLARQGVRPVNCITQSQVFTRFNCAIF